MAPSIVHLPNGQNLTVSPVFGGLFFKSNNVNHHHSPFPAGWTVVLNTEDDTADDADSLEAVEEHDSRSSRRSATHRYKKPTLHNDHLFISSISNPNSNDYKPAGSPTRQIAMMLWATLWWYFHQPSPDPRLANEHSIHTPDEGKPHGEWRININREGIFTGKVLLPKLERMGLVSSEESSVGLYQDDRAGEGWLNMFVSRRSFWQMDPRIYLYTMSAIAQSPYPAGSPYTSRPSSPNGEGKKEHSPEPVGSAGLWSPTAPGPFHSTSHLPTFYPPPPQQYKFTNNIRHPIRPKPPRQGEVFYTRFVPSVGQYLSFRVASLAPKPPPHRGPSNVSSPNVAQFRQSQIGEAWPPTVQNLNLGPCDLDLLEKWMNDPRIARAWGEDGPRERQESFLRGNMTSKHSFPVIGCWDGKPFGYFELYWVKEDALGKHLPHVGDYDRGFHCLVGEQEYRGPQRARIWLSALAHYCFLADNRTDTVMLEPRVDNETLARYCTDVGFFKEREVSFPHKQANLFKIKRDAWVGPEI